MALILCILQNPTTPMEMNRAMKEVKRHRKNSTLLMAIAVMFTMCWFPLTLLNLLADMNYFIFMYKNFLLAFAVAHLVAMISACLNPIVYGWFNVNFRREFSRIACFWRNEELFYPDGEKRQLVCGDAYGRDGGIAGGPAARGTERQRIVYKKNLSYKTIQTQTAQSVYMRQDSPMTMKYSLDLGSSSTWQGAFQ